MNDIREIVTKAVVAKGKKIIRETTNITPDNQADAILGCWIINHQFEAELSGDKANVLGEYEVNIWYSYDNNSKTDIARKVVNYEKKINTRNIVTDINRDCRDILITATQSPTCTNAQIVNDDICVDCTFELLAEVIGETKVKVAILHQNDYYDFTNEDFEDEINEDFIIEKDNNNQE